MQNLYIDVNDPRNEQIIRKIKEHTNEFLKRLLIEDSRNLLADEEPFRHKLLKMRNMDVDLANKFIPFLESEIIDSSKSQLFLSKLEEIYRNEAYTKYVTKQKQVKPGQVNKGLADADDLVDTATHDRRR